MKIAHLIPHFPLPFVGGAEACIHNLAKTQADMGHMVKVIAPKKKNRLPLNYEILPLTIIKPLETLIIPFVNRHLLWQLQIYQSRYSFDIWQVTMGFPFAIATVEFFNKKNIPCILRCSGEDIQKEPLIRYGKRMNVIYDFLIRKHYPKFDGLISIADAITRNYKEIEVPEEKIYFIRNGVNKRLFDDIKISKERLKEKIGIGGRKRLILTVGRNHPKKGFFYIPDIIKRTVETNRNFVWFLIGHNNGIIKKIAESKGVGDFIIVKEIRSKSNTDGEITFPDRELVRLYKSADIFVFPSLIEGCSNVLLEAMAAGLPIVATEAEGIRDMLVDGETALLSKKADPDDLADKLRLLLNDSLLCEKLGKNALERTKDLDWSIVAGRYINVYEEVIRLRKKKVYG